MATTKEPLYVIRNRQTGRYISIIDYGYKPPRPIYEDSYHVPKLFCHYNIENAMRIAGLDDDTFEKVPVTLILVDV